MCKLEKCHKCSSSWFPHNTFSQMEKRELGIGSFKQLVENTQENTDVVTYYNVSLLILFYATLLLWGPIYLPGRPCAVAWGCDLVSSVTLGCPLSLPFPSPPILFLVSSASVSLIEHLDMSPVSGSIFKEPGLRHLVKNEFIWSCLTDDNSVQIVWAQTDLLVANSL